MDALLTSPTPKTPVPETCLNHRFLDFLKLELEKRKARRPGYSVRAMARQLRVQSSYLSKILRGERRATDRFIESAGRSLDLSENEILEFIEQNTTSSRKYVPHQKRFKILPEDMFIAISGWHHFAILELTKVEGFRSDIQWIADALEIPFSEASAAIDRLLRLGLLSLKKGTFVCAGSFSNALDIHLVNRAQKALQRDVIRLSEVALDKHDVSERDQSSVTLACSASDLPLIKTQIRTFRRKLAHFAENLCGGKGDTVYHFGISFYPVSKKPKVPARTRRPRS